MILELTQTKWLTTPKGKALAWFLIDRGAEADLEWVTVIMEGPHVGEVWTWSNWDVRAVQNVTMGRVPNER